MLKDSQTTELTALHALATHDLVDILTNDGFSADEKSAAARIVKERFYALQTKFDNLSRRVMVL